MANLTTGASEPPWQRLRAALFDQQDGPLPSLLLALTALAGVVDAVSILRLGGVFVATMTGNLVFIGLALAGARGFAVAPCALALGGFVIGVLLGGQACRLARSHRGLALRNVLAIKLSLASVITVIVIITGPRLPLGARDALLVLLAMSMGSQLAAIRYLKVPDMLTVVLTMIITGALIEHGSGWTHPKMLRRGLTILAFALGALSSALLILNVGLVAALVLGLTIIVSVAIAAHAVSQTSAGWSAPRTA